MADSKTVSSDVQKAYGAIQKDYDEANFESVFEAGGKSSASAGDYARRIVASGMKDRTATGPVKSQEQKDIERSRP